MQKLKPVHVPSLNTCTCCYCVFTCYPCVDWLYTIFAIFRCLYIHVYLSFSLDLILIDWCFQRRVYLVCGCVLSFIIGVPLCILTLLINVNIVEYWKCKFGKQMFLIQKNYIWYDLNLAPYNLSFFKVFWIH